MIRSLIIIILFSMCFLIFSQTNSDTKKKSISFEEYLNTIKKKVPELQANENSLLQAKNDLAMARGIYDVELNASFNGLGKKTYPDGSPVELDYSAGFKGEGSITALIPSGTRLSVGGYYTQMYSWGIEKTMDYMTFSEKTNGFNTITWDPAIKIVITQPLIYNWFGFLDRFAVKNAKMRLDIEKLKKIENDNEIINYYKKLYFYWVQYTRMLSYLEKAIINSKKLEQETAERLKLGAAENDDYQRTRLAVLKFQEQYDTVRIEFLKIENEIKLYFEENEILPSLEDFDEIYKNFTGIETKFIEFEKTRSSKIFTLNKENFEYQKKIKFNSLLPRLNLFGSLDIKFHQYRYDPRSDSDNKVSYDSSNGDVDFIAGLEFTFPLTNFKGRGEYKQSDIMLKDLLLQYDITKNNYVKSLRSIINSIELLKKVSDIKTQNVDSLYSRLKTENRKYNQARLDLMTKIDTENQIVIEEIDFMKTKAALIALYLDYQKFTE